MRESLSVSYLQDRGFVRSGHWIADGNKVRMTGEMPRCEGVYAFAIAERVMYIGLASANLAKRLYFYQNPGAGQRTNLRLNAIILDVVKSSEVIVLTASPGSFEWNGLPVLGAHGLEAGLIRTFDLPWNQRGQLSTIDRTMPLAPTVTLSAAKVPATLAHQVQEAIRAHPSSTEAELARYIFGRDGYQQKVNPICRRLVQAGVIRRLGSGGPADPYVYVLVAA